MDGVLLAIDGNALVHRSFHGHAGAAAATGAGRPAWAVRGLLTQLVAAVERIRPTSVLIGFDDPGHSVRRERWPQYKAHRVRKLDTLVDQLAAAVEAVRALGIPVIVPPGLEADDVLASAAARAPRHGARTVIVTSDRDAFALIDESTSVLRIINGGVDAAPLLTVERLHLLLGIRPDQYRDFAALRGDPADNLPGVRGVGPRTASRLLGEFGCAAAAFADLDAVRARLGPTVARRLADPDAHARFSLNCQVMAMRHDVDVGFDGGLGTLPLDAAAVAEVFRAQQLTWSTAHAVRVLADAEPPPPDPTRWTRATGPAANWSARTRRARLPRLSRQPAMDQLALFEL